MAGSPTSTNSSLSSSQRFGLDDRDTRKILVYNHPYGLSTSSEQDLCKQLDSGEFPALNICDWTLTKSPLDQNLRVSKVRIPWGNSHVDIRQRDLIPADQLSEIDDKPTLNLSLASINLGRLRHLKRLIGLQRDLYVVSPQSSPNSSPENSQQVSRNSTFPQDGTAGHGNDEQQKADGDDEDPVLAGANRVQF